MHQDANRNKLLSNLSTTEDDEEDVPSSPQTEESDPCSPQNQESIPGSPQNQESVPGSPQNQESLLASPRNQDSTLGSPQNQESTPCSPQNESPQQISSLSSGHEINPMDMDSENNHIMSKSDNAPGDESEYSGNFNTAVVAVSQGVPLTSGDDIWPAVSMQHSYFDSTASHDFTAASGLPLGCSQVNEQQRAHLVDLESDLQVEETEKDILHRQSGEFSFSSYPNQDRNELLQSLFKSQEMSYHQEQKQKGLEFQPPNNSLMENGRFSHHFHEQPLQSLPLEQEQKRHNEVYMQRNISGNLYSEGVRFLIPRQEQLAPVNMQDLTVNTVRMSAPLQSGLNGGELLSQNWFSGEHQVHGGWTGSDVASVQSQSIVSGSGADQNLLHILSHCNQLRPSGPYASVGSAEQFSALRNYGMVGGGAPRISNVLPQASHALDYLSGREAATSMMPDDMGWMSLPHQSSVLHDSMGKPYLRSWNN